ncbi:MAG: hypothetical protein WBB70_00520 [Desulfobacterales bacterium]
MTENTVTSKDTTRQENDRAITKAKKHETPKEFMNHVREEVKKLEGCDFE